MKFAPKTDREIAEANLWPDGVYSFEIVDGIDKMSKAQNEMIELKVKVFNEEGGHIFVNDYLLESIAYKLRHAAVACGLTAQYEGGSLAGMDFVGKCGTLKLKVQKSKDPAYADKNVISDYVVKKDGDSAPAAHVASAGTPIEQDDCPF